MKTLLVIAILAAVGVNTPALAQMTTADGICLPSSHTVHGRLGTDLSKHHVRFRCDAAVVSFTNSGHRFLAQFAVKESSVGGGLIGFAGNVVAGSAMLPVDRLYLTSGAASPADGMCDFGVGNVVSCVAKTDANGYRTIAEVDFRGAR